MRGLRCSSVVRLLGLPFPQPRGPLGLLRPSRRGSSPERDNTMIMDHDIARNDCAALELREGASLPPQEPDSHEDQPEDGQGPAASPVARLPQRQRSASMIVTLAPCPASLVVRTTAEVDFPAPPLGLAKTMVGMPTNCRRPANKH